LTGRLVCAIMTTEINTVLPPGSDASASVYTSLGL